MIGRMAEVLDKSNCGVARPYGKEATVKPVNRRTETPFVQTRLALGISPGEVHLASRCRRGYWWMSGNGIVQRALHNAWLAKQGVPNLRQQWIGLHYGQRNPHWNPAAVNLTGTA
jgi:hypothetical protein